MVEAIKQIINVGLKILRFVQLILDVKDLTKDLPPIKKPPLWKRILNKILGRKPWWERYI